MGLARGFSFQQIYGGLDGRPSWASAVFWYGWPDKTKVHWIVPIIGTAVLGLDVVATMILTFSYLVGAFGIHSASAKAANISFRCVTGAFLPLIAPPS